MTQPIQLQFSLSSTDAVEFGVGYDSTDGQAFSLVAIDPSVQIELRSMIDNTLNSKRDLIDNPPKYDPANRYRDDDYYLVDLSDPIAKVFKDIHGTKNIITESSTLESPDRIYFYFARLTDENGQRLIALRRSSQFKGQLKKKNRLLSMFDDTLTFVENDVFTLNDDFDCLVDAAHVHVFRPKGFDVLAQTQQKVMASVRANIDLIKGDIEFVKFENIIDYASSHVSSARLVASIQSRGFARGVDKHKLLNLCQKTGVSVEEIGDSIHVHEQSIVGFLEVLDRRRYEIEITESGPESYRASIREKIPPTN